MKKLVTGFLLLASGWCPAQNFQSLDTIKALPGFDNIYTHPVYSDSLVSSFVIFIKKEVRAHKHVTHAEHVYVLEGKGEMTMANQSFKVKEGDMIFIPKNTVHSLKVLSDTPVKVLSIQAPFFDGTDRVFVE